MNAILRFFLVKRPTCPILAASSVLACIHYVRSILQLQIEWWLQNEKEMGYREGPAVKVTSNMTRVRFYEQNIWFFENKILNRIRTIFFDNRFMDFSVFVWKILKNRIKLMVFTKIISVWKIEPNTYNWDWYVFTTKFN